MTFIPDLTPYAPADSLIAVGWLEDELPPPAGGIHAPDEVVEKLVQIFLAKLPRFLPYFLGYHPCGLCPNAPPRTATSIQYGGRTLELGCGELLVPVDGFVYVAPNLLIHYIRDHFYRPPLEFCQAAMRCPAPDSYRYRQALRANGPAAFRWDVEDPERSLWRRSLMPLVHSERFSASAAGRRFLRVLRAL
jgi:hypothetical protein